MRRHSLRLRVAFAFAGLGALLSLLLTGSIWFAAHDGSRLLMDETLKAELDDYIARRARNPDSLPPDTAGLRGYLVRHGGTADPLPAALLSLPDGRHDVQLAGRPYRVAIAEHDDARYVILLDAQPQQARERRFLAYLIGAAALLTLLAAVGGLWLAGRVIAPVSQLAKAVGAARGGDLPTLAVAGEPADEIAELAGAFDRYLERLAAFVDRERVFAADASHELRTPLAVISGAAEVLADDPHLSASQARCVARIRRAAADMAELIAALLLAREEATPIDASCDAVRIANDCLERHQALAGSHGTTLSLTAPAPVTLAVPAALFAIVVANLVRNAIDHSRAGAVAIRLDMERLTVQDSGVGIGDSEISQVFRRYYRGPASGGAGIGLSLVKRICDRYGWRIELAAVPTGGTIATLRFGA
jgi:signal transduction histidine kinase